MKKEQEILLLSLERGWGKRREEWDRRSQPPTFKNVSGEYPAHVVVSLAYTDMRVDMVAALHASCTTCVSTVVYTICEW